MSDASVERVNREVAEHITRYGFHDFVPSKTSNWRCKKCGEIPAHPVHDARIARAASFAGRS